MTWHIPVDTLAAYQGERLNDTDAWSVEAHLAACERCRHALADDAIADPGRATALAAGWSAVESRLQAAQGRARPGTTWRELVILAAAGPAARLAWLVACPVVLAIAVLLGTNDVSTLPWVGMVAPILPLLGVAASYGSGLDDAYEVIASTPSGGFRLLLIRSAVVLAVTTPLALGAGVVTGYGSPVPWLLASLGLTSATLALGSVIGVERAAAVCGLTWVVAVGNLTKVADLHVPVVLTPEAMPAWFAVAVLASIVVFIRRQAYNRMPTTRIEVLR